MHFNTMKKTNIALCLALLKPFFTICLNTELPNYS